MAVSQHVFEKLFDERKARGIAEPLTPMGGAVDDLESYRQPMSLVGSVQLVGLVDRNLWILISVKNEQGGIRGVDVSHRTSEPCQIGHLVGTASEKQFQRRHPDAQTVGSGLLENRGEIRWPVQIHDRLDGG